MNNSLKLYWSWCRPGLQHVLVSCLGGGHLFAQALASPTEDGRSNRSDSDNPGHSKALASVGFPRASPARWGNPNPSSKTWSRIPTGNVFAAMQIGAYVLLLAVAVLWWNPKSGLQIHHQSRNRRIEPDMNPSGNGGPCEARRSGKGRLTQLVASAEISQNGDSHHTLLKEQVV